MRSCDPAGTTSLHVLPVAVREEGRASVMRRPEQQGAGEKGWALWRQDDNGHRFLVLVRSTRNQAEGERNSYERLGHKQFYWIEPYRG